MLYYSKLQHNMMARVPPADRQAPLRERPTRRVRAETVILVVQSSCFSFLPFYICCFYVCAVFLFIVLMFK